MTKATTGAVPVAIGGLVALAAAMGIGRFVYTPILPFMAEGVPLTQAEAGVIASANFLGYLVGALAAALGTLPGGRRLWFLAALAVSALSTGAMGLTTAMAAFLALGLVGGVASAFVLVLASALVLDRLSAAGRNGLAAVHFGGVGTGIAVSAVLVAGLAAAGGGWQAQWLAAGAVSLVALALSATLVPRGPDIAAVVRSAPGGRVDRRLVALIVAYGLFGFGYVITATFISAIVRAAPELQPFEPVVWLAVGLAAVPSVAFWTWVARRWGDDRAFALACLVEAAGVAMSVLVTEGWAVLLAAAFLGGTFVGITALGLIRARALSVRDPRRTLALMTASFGLGQMVGPTFAGAAYDIAGSFLLPSLVAVAALVLAAGLVVNPLALVATGRRSP